MKKPPSFVWVADDEKYGIQQLFATKKAADKLYGPKAKKYRWLTQGVIYRMDVCR